MLILPYPLSQLIDLVKNNIYELEYKLPRKPTAEQEKTFQERVKKYIPEVEFRSAVWVDKELKYIITVKYIGMAGVSRILTSDEMSKVVLRELKKSGIDVYEITNTTEYNAIGQKIEQVIDTAKETATKVVPDVSKILGEALAGIWKPLHPILITIAVILVAGLVAYFIFKKEIV